MTEASVAQARACAAVISPMPEVWVRRWRIVTRWPLRRRGLLGGEGLAEGALLERDILLVAVGVDEGVPPPLLEEGVPLYHAVVAAVGAEEHVAGQALEDLEGPGEVGGDL